MASPYIPLQIEHIVARKHGGDDALENLAIAGADYNLRKSRDLAGIDQVTHELTRLFNPRTDVWSEHFEWNGIRVAGRTAIGRTTVQVLSLNLPSRLRIRRALLKRGLFP
jgi:hypothetical protein